MNLHGKPSLIAPELLSTTKFILRGKFEKSCFKTKLLYWTFWFRPNKIFLQYARKISITHN